MTKNDDGLMPCPFCPDGGKPKLFENRWSSHPYEVVCVSEDKSREQKICNAKRWPSYTREEAIAAWNVRATPPPAQDEIADEQTDNHGRLV